MWGRLRRPKVVESNELEDVTDGAFETDGARTVVFDSQLGRGDDNLALSK